MAAASKMCFAPENCGCAWKRNEFPLTNIRECVIWYVACDWVTHSNSSRDARFEFIRSIIAGDEATKKNTSAQRTQFCHSVAILIQCIWIFIPMSAQLTQTLATGKTVEQRTSISPGRWLCCAFSSEQLYSTKFPSHLNYKRNLPDSNIYRCLQPTLDCILFSIIELYSIAELYSGKRVHSTAFSQIDKIHAIDSTWLCGVCVCVLSCWAHMHLHAFRTWAGCRPLLSLISLCGQPFHHSLVGRSTFPQFWFDFRFFLLSFTFSAIVPRHCFPQHRHDQ